MVAYEDVCKVNPTTIAIKGFFGMLATTGRGSGGTLSTDAVSSVFSCSLSSPSASSSSLFDEDADTGGGRETGEIGGFSITMSSWFNFIKSVGNKGCKG